MDMELLKECVLPMPLLIRCHSHLESSFLVHSAWPDIIQQIIMDLAVLEEPVEPRAFIGRYVAEALLRLADFSLSFANV